LLLFSYSAFLFMRTTRQDEQDLRVNFFHASIMSILLILSDYDLTGWDVGLDVRRIGREDQGFAALAFVRTGKAGIGGRPLLHG
jgi:hypothetical protein